MGDLTLVKSECLRTFAGCANFSSHIFQPQRHEERKDGSCFAVFFALFVSLRLIWRRHISLLSGCSAFLAAHFTREKNWHCSGFQANITSNETINRRISMRVMLSVRLPHQPFNAAVKDGTAGAKINRILEAINLWGWTIEIT